MQKSDRQRGGGGGANVTKTDDMRTSSNRVTSNQPRNSRTSSSSNSLELFVGPNYRVGKKIGCGNFGELRLGESIIE